MNKIGHNLGEGPNRSVELECAMSSGAPDFLPTATVTGKPIDVAIAFVD